MEIRPLRWPDEIALWAALLNELEPDRPVLAGALQARHETRADSGFFLAFEGDEAVGCGTTSRRSDARLPGAHVLVLPAHRHRGVGSALVAEVSACAAGHGHGELDSSVREGDAEALAFATARGFVETGRRSEFELDLRALESPVVELPDGIEIVTWAERPELTQALHEIDLETVPDIPGEEDYVPEPLETWLANTMRNPGHTPDAVFIALAGDGELAGYAKLSTFVARPSAAHHDMTGVRRAWRGRGVAAALKAAQIRWAKEAGYETLVTQTEGRNAPIRRLNERFGYRQVGGTIMLRGPIAGSSS